MLYTDRPTRVQRKKYRGPVADGCISTKIRIGSALYFRHIPNGWDGPGSRLCFFPQPIAKIAKVLNSEGKSCENAETPPGVSFDAWYSIAASTNTNINKRISVCRPSCKILVQVCLRVASSGPHFQGRSISLRSPHEERLVMFRTREFWKIPCFLETAGPRLPESSKDFGGIGEMREFESHFCLVMWGYLHR